MYPVYLSAATSASVCFKVALVVLFESCADAMRFYLNFRFKILYFHDTLCITSQPCVFVYPKSEAKSRDQEQEMYLCAEATLKLSRRLS